jgi:hypothetical protein
VWSAELPFSETSIVRQLQTWPVAGHLVVVGELETQDDATVTHRDPYLASIDLATGAVASGKLTALSR